MWRFFYIEDDKVLTRDFADDMGAQEFDKKCRVNTVPFIVYDIVDGRNSRIKNLDYYGSKVEAAMAEGKIVL